MANLLGNAVCVSKLSLTSIESCLIWPDILSRSEGFALTGYDIPGCVEEGAWRLWENSSVAVAAVVTHPGLGRGQLSVLLQLRRFQDAGIDPSRLPSTDGPNITESCRRKKSDIKKESRKIKKKRLKKTA